MSKLQGVKEMSVNKVILVGEVSDPVKMREATNGSTCANLNVKTKNMFKGKTYDSYHKVVLWGDVTHLSDVKPGEVVSVEGRMQTRSYMGKQGGKVYVTEVVATSVTPIVSTAFVPPPVAKVFDEQTETDVPF